MAEAEGDVIDVKEIRRRHGWSQRELAEHLGCDTSTVCRIEAGAPISGPIGKLLKLIDADPSTVSGQGAGT